MSSQWMGERMVYSISSLVSKVNWLLLWYFTSSTAPKQNTARNLSLYSAASRALVPPVLWPPR